MNCNKLGEAIRLARGNKPLRKFAKEIGICHTRLDSIERGYDPRTGKRVNITVSTLQKIARATGIDVFQIIEEEAKVANNEHG